MDIINNQPTRKRRLNGVFIAIAAAITLLGTSACTSSTDPAGTENAAESVAGTENAAESAAGTENAARSVAATENAAQSVASSVASAEPAFSAEPVPSAATTAVAAPGGGDVNQTVAEVPGTTRPPISSDATADIGGSVTARIVDSKSITGVARGIGEVGGPAIALTIQVDNGSSASIQLNGVQVTVEDSAKNPANSLSGEPAAPLLGMLDPGGIATGVFVFALPASSQNPLNVAVSYSAGFPVALFAVNAK